MLRAAGQKARRPGRRDTPGRSEEIGGLQAHHLEGLDPEDREAAYVTEGGDVSVGEGAASQSLEEEGENVFPIIAAKCRRQKEHGPNVG